jgi:hypothetical protein
MANSPPLPPLATAAPPAAAGDPHAWTEPPSPAAIAARTEALLDRARVRALPPAEVDELVSALPFVPGRARAIALALAQQRDAAAVEGLRRMTPGIPGVVEGLYQALAAGVARLSPAGAPVVRALALEFRPSRARGFPALLERARATFEDDLELLQLPGPPRGSANLLYRARVREGGGTLAGRTAAIAADLTWMHARLARWRGTRVWLNGWPFASEGPWPAPVQAHLVRAWLTWASHQVHTRSSPSPAAKLGPGESGP